MRKIYLVALLIAVSLFSTVNYIQYSRVVRDKEQLLENIEQLSKKLVILVNEREDLIQQISSKTPVEGDRESLIQKLSRISAELAEAKNTIEQLQLSMAALQEEKEIIKQEAKKVGDEKAYLEARLHSLKELKKAIREIKKDMSLVKRQMQRRIDKVASTEGNRGYLVRDGKSTFKKKMIRVIPVEASH